MRRLKNIWYGIALIALLPVYAVIGIWLIVEHKRHVRRLRKRQDR